MSSESLAVFRRGVGEDLAKLAEQHIQHDLTPVDRDNLQSAARSLSNQAVVGSFIGLALGAFFAFRLRQNRARMYEAFRAAEKPTHLKFSDGRELPIPDLAPLMKPSAVGDVAAYTLFAAGGLLLGGEAGFLTGSWNARRTIAGNPESKRRIEEAFRKFKADVLRKELEQLERGESQLPIW